MFVCIPSPGTGIHLHNSSPTRSIRFDSMAGWINSSGTGTGGGRGAGGRGFTTRRYTTDIIHCGGGGRWRGERPRGRPPPQPHYRYRPVDAAHRHSPPALSDQAASSTSTRHAQITTDNKSSGTAAPASTKEPDDKAGHNAANFECNVCFDMAAEPVVTKCGHLFCWECLCGQRAAKAHQGQS
uniref:E3 ubiquitin-protein ligase RMA n=1 Tax=Arundo donax TaxID=35708 RepID=A0A0A9DAP1_ARUDO